MTTPRRLRKDGRKRTPKMIAVTAAKARLRRAGSVATVSRDWHVIWPQKSKPLDVTPVAYDKAPSPWLDAAIALLGLVVIAIASAVIA